MHIMIITRSDRSSQTFAENGAATWRTQRNVRFRPISPIGVESRKIQNPQKNSDHHQNLTNSFSPESFIKMRSFLSFLDTNCQIRNITSAVLRPS